MSQLSGLESLFDGLDLSLLEVSPRTVQAITDFNKEDLGLRSKKVDSGYFSSSEEEDDDEEEDEDLITVVDVHQSDVDQGEDDKTTIKSFNSHKLQSPCRGNANKKKSHKKKKRKNCVKAFVTMSLGLAARVMRTKKTDYSRRLRVVRKLRERHSCHLTFPAFV